MLQRRTRLPKPVVADAELPYAREFDNDEEIAFFGFSLSDLRGIDIGYAHVNRKGCTHANADKIVFVDHRDAG